ncbi:MAG: metallophosphoesterase, partial [Pseudorhizobium sp.]
MFHLMFGVPWLIVATRFILPLPWSWALKIAVAIILLIASQYHFFSRLSSGSVFSPEFPRPLILAFNLLIGAMLMLAVFQLLLDAVSLMLLVFKWSFPVVPAGVRYGIGGLALALSAVGVSQAVRVPPTKDIEVTIAGLPAAFDGYRLVQLTDL